MNNNYLKYIKYKKKYLNIKKIIGGNITATDLNVYGGLFPIIIFMRNHVINNIIPNCNMNTTNNDKITLISIGANGMGLVIECNNGTKYCVKIVINAGDAYGCTTSTDEKRIYSSMINDEYNKINMFNSNTIVKTYGKFIFNKTNPNLNVNDEDMLGELNYTNINNETKSIIINADSQYKIKCIEPDYPPFYPNIIGGILLEYIKDGFDKINELSLNYTNKLQIFNDYVTGLKIIYEKGYAHTDIKPDNLRIGFNGTRHTGKIIDIDMITYTDIHLESYRLTQLAYRSIQYQSETINKQLVAINQKIIPLIGKTDADLVKKQAEFRAQLKDIASKGDLYALAKSFKELNVFNGDATLTDLLEKCLDFQYNLENITGELNRLLLNYEGEPEPEPLPEPEPEPETKVESEPETKVESEPETDSESKVKLDRRRRIEKSKQLLKLQKNKKPLVETPQKAKLPMFTPIETKRREETPQKAKLPMFTPIETKRLSKTSTR
jgi:serine/threonine protein kinase